MASIKTLIIVFLALAALLIASASAGPILGGNIADLEIDVDPTIFGIRIPIDAKLKL